MSRIVGSHGAFGEFVSGASINYRLSPQVKHPEHLYDVLEALNFLKLRYEPDEFLLVGHSAGGFLAMQATTKTEWTEHYADVLSLITVVVCSEAIYDLPSLVDEYPSYGDFVRNAFGDDEAAWAKASPFRHGKLSGFFEDLEVTFVHSSQDELLTFRQVGYATKRWETHVKNKYSLQTSPEIQFFTVEGKHNDVYQSPALLAILGTHLPFDDAGDYDSKDGDQ